MREYSSKITEQPDGKVSVVTWGEEPKTASQVLAALADGPKTYEYPSVEKLREALVRQKFHAELAKKGGFYVSIGGLSLAFVSKLAANYLPLNEVQQVATDLIFKGGLILSISTKVTTGILMKDSVDVYKQKVDSRVKEFNGNFRKLHPELDPVFFSPREYLSTLRLPFRR